MSRSLSSRAARCSILVALAAAGATGRAQQPPTFQSGVDLVAVDVQVIDRSGAPVTGLRPDQFSVTIDGKRRKVVAADFIGAPPSPSAGAATGGASISTAAPSSPGPDVPAGRIYVLAFDSMSFDALATAPARQAARAFVERLSPNDRVGLIDFPWGSALDPTTDRASLLNTLERVVGRAGPAAFNRFSLTPSEISDLTYLSESGNVQLLGPRVHEICAFSDDPDDCQQQVAGTYRVVKEASALAQFEEAEIGQRLGALQASLRALGADPQRKIVVLVSAGMMVSDRPGGRPSLQGFARIVGEAAAQANCAIYALHFDRIRMDRTSASRGGARPSDIQRDSAMLARPLDDLAGTAGGTSVTVVQGGGEFAFDRILKETSAYYLLGVEPLPGDRDGRRHQLGVKVATRDVTVRSRSWVSLDRPRAVSAPVVSSRPVERPPPPPSVRPLAEAYGRRSYDEFTRLLAAVQDPANVLRDFRTADPAWPETRRTDRVLALELALAGLSNANGFAKDEGLRLLALVHSAMEQSSDRAFACAWFHTEAAMLEGLGRPSVALPFVTRAMERCPADARLPLARGVLLEQQLRQTGAVTLAADIVAAYTTVPDDPAARLEADIRTAGCLVRHPQGKPSDILDAARLRASPDAYLRYVGHLVRGEQLRAAGQLDAAAEAFLDAVAEAPRGQSAQLALMAVRILQAKPDEAARLAHSVLTQPRDASDPWWTYNVGDFRSYPALLDRLRGMSQ